MEGGLIDKDLFAEIGKIIRWFRKNGFGDKQPATNTFSPIESPILFRNDAAETIPAYACMEIDGTAEVDGQNYIKVKKPTSSAIAYLFNGPNAVTTSDPYGSAQRSPVVKAYKNSGTVTDGDRWGPTVGQWYLTKGVGEYVAVGADDVETNVFKVIRCHVSRLYRFTLNATLASGTADADILEMDGTDTGIDDTVRDPEGIFASLVTVGDSGLCLMQDGKFYVIQAPCP